MDETIIYKDKRAIARFDTETDQLIVGTIFGKDIKGSVFCEFYNETLCAESQQECSGREECILHDPDKRNHCYVLWRVDNATKKTTIKLKVSLRYSTRNIIVIALFGCVLD